MTRVVSFLCAGCLALLAACGQEGTTGVGSPSAPPSTGSQPSPSGDEVARGSQANGSADQTTAGSSATETAPFFPNLFAQIDGRSKRFKLSSWRATSNPSGARIEFSTGLRSLGEEAAPGEIYSEVWLLFGIEGSERTPDRGVYECSPPDARSPGTRWAELYWSYNHIGNNRRDYSTELSRGPCRITVDAFEPTAGGTFKGTFSGTLDGSIAIAGGSFSVVFPTDQDLLP